MITTKMKFCMKQQKSIHLEHRKTKGQRLASLLGMKQKKKLHNFTAILTRFFVAAAVAAAAKLHSFLCLKNGKNAAFKGKKIPYFPNWTFNMLSYTAKIR